jgi:hypothetical protein
MRRLQIKKKLIALAVGSISLAACSGQQPQKTVLYCHHWTAGEILQIKQADSDLDDDSPLHGVIKDYERVCANLVDN